ncbi:hypothetical protein CASFOL_034514 [Castilleja foliolosa]|uniref:Uncharacterized protein n=1 Tax=Castilleja foliolosa TaxID=1961234 RepID=A0ABD3BQR0_9LAMI
MTTDSSPVSPKLISPPLKSNSPISRRSSRGVKATKSSISDNPNWIGNIWTAFYPYCYNLYEYPWIYEGCCLRCDNENCKRAFTATPILSMLPMVPGLEAYFCCWGFFPMGFASGKVGKENGFPKRMPPMFGESNEAAPVEEEAPAVPPPPPTAPENVMHVAPVAASPAASSVRKRGRPKKNV